MKVPSSRRLAQSWPHDRYNKFVKELRTAATSWFSGKMYQTHSTMEYCLVQHADWHNNIICKNVVDYLDQNIAEYKGKNSFPLHKYLHHGLSSQAMTFNLLGPLVVAKDYAPLQKALEKCGIEWPEGELKAEFEYDDRLTFNEDSSQPTSIDFALLGKKKSLFIEVKLREQEFGGCSIFKSGDCEGQNPYPDRNSCYLHHIGRKYWEKMDEYKLSEASIAKGVICPFANYYQFFREVLFALSNKGCFVLLYDERNPAFLRSGDNGKPDRGLWPFLYATIPHDLRNSVGRLTVQALVEEIEKVDQHKGWIGEFKAKYGLQ